MSEVALSPRTLTIAPDSSREGAAWRLAFRLFLLANAVLILRPMDIIVPTLKSLPIYDWLMVLTLLLAIGHVLSQLRLAALREQPITACIIGFCVAVFLSHASHMKFEAALDAGIEFAKVVLYYMLIVALLDSSRRLATFTCFFMLCLAGLALLPLLQLHGFIHMADLEPLRDTAFDPRTGKNFTFLRLCGPGIFHDPNDFCHLLATSVPLCLYVLSRRRGGLRWVPCAALLGMVGYAIILTQSRGGFLALLVGIGTLLLCRYGWRRSMIVGAFLLPLLFVLFAGRQTDLSTSSDTGHARIVLWAQALSEFRDNPLFGVGQGKFGIDAGLVAHNSFLHSFAETGFFGGVMFLGVFVLSLRALMTEPKGAAAADEQLVQLRPYLLAALSAYIAGMLSLSHSYAVLTYTLPGVAVAYQRLAAPGAGPQWSGRLLTGLAALGVAFIVLIHLFVRVSIHGS